MTEISVMKVLTGLDYVEQNSKPDKFGIVESKKRACANYVNIDVMELADCVGNKGMSFVPGILEGGMSADNCTGMQLFVLDFDNKSDSKKVFFSDIKERCDTWGIPISFAYHTFSSTSETEKFRIVLAHETLIEDAYVVKVILAMLQKIFPECDPACKNLDRIFLGGKECIYCDPNAHLALIQLLSPFESALKEHNNYPNEMRNFCKQNHVLIFNSHPAIGQGDYFNTILSELSENNGNLENTINHIIGNSNFPLFFIIESENLHESIRCEIDTRKINLTKCTGCRLFDSFASGVDVGHQARFALLTNLVHISGGRKFFFDTLQKYSDDDPDRYDEWARSVQYIDKKHLPMRCSATFCPFYDVCNNNGTILATLSTDREVRCLREETYHDIEEVEEDLVQDIEEAALSHRKGLTLIKAQTGIGKTYAYIKFIAEDTHNRYLIACPTNILKDEVYNELRAYLPESEVYKTLSISDNHTLLPKELRDEMQELYESGIYDEPKELLKEYRDEIQNDPNKRAVLEECDKILRGADKIKEQRVVVTTLAYMAQLPESMLSRFIVIVDEDILNLYFLRQIKRVSLSLITEASTKGLSFYSDISKKLVDAPLDHYGKLTPSPYTPPLTMDELNENELWSSKDDNLNDLRNAVSYVKKEEDDETYILYFCQPKLYENVQYIVCSATLNLEAYQNFFKGISIYACKEMKASYKGTLEQYTYHTLGRRDLSGKLQVYDLARQLSENDELPIITFLMYGSYTNGFNKGIHFGNEMGINFFKGNDLAVIGTPYMREEAYKLPACYLGADVNKKDDLAPKPRRVEWNNMSFIFTTYQDPVLQNLQMYMISSTLEQSVGRARLLRCDCTVYVFSSFPCEQAIIHPENYL